MHILGQIWPFFGPKSYFFPRERKFCYSPIRKPTRHLVLVPIVFWSGTAPKWTRKSKMTFFGHFGAKNPNPRSQYFVLELRFFCQKGISLVRSRLPTPKKVFVSELGVIFQGSSRNLAISGQCPIVSISALNFGP